MFSKKTGSIVLLILLIKNYKNELVLDVLLPNFSFRPYSIDSTVANEVKRPTHILLKMLNLNATSAQIENEN